MSVGSENPISRSAGEDGQADDWLGFAQAQTAEQLCRTWLPVLCGMIAGARTGLLLLQDPDGSYAPIAVWPGEADLSYLGPVAQEALVQRRGVVKRPGGSIQFAYPLATDKDLFGAVVVELDDTDEAALTNAIRQMHWGAGWLIELHSRRTLGEQAAVIERSSFLFDIVLAALAEQDLDKAGLAVVNRLAQRFGCHQVQLGVERGKTVRVAAVSHSAWFDEKANIVNLAAQAMNEAFDQRARIVLPEAEQGASLITLGLRRYAEETGSRSLCALPLEAGNHVVGVWLLERDEPFSSADQEALETISLALGPVFELKETAEENLASHAARSWKRLLQRITDTSHPGFKLLAASVVLVTLFLAFFPTDYRVASQASVEGSVQRVAVAPFQGYVREAPARAGDLVKQGQVLAVLEDKDLKLERVRWESELEVALRKEREGMAKADRVAARLASAQAAQANAQLDLVLEKLARVQVTAPFDGVVVHGDLSQQLGSPVEQGKILFELAPLDTWRVILKVDERDIAHLREGSPGELVLTSLPGQVIALKVKKITPVSTAEEGRNYFRVEAELPEGPAKLRPGMEGVAKVNAGERSLLWIWTHRLTDWVRLLVWEYTP